VDTNQLKMFVNEVRPVLIEAICTGVQEHVASMRTKGIDFYAYALLPGEFDDLASLCSGNKLFR
jgi:hypothetical protein